MRSTRTCAAIQHVSFEDLGVLRDVLERRGLAIQALQAGIDDLAPARDAELLVVLGGPIGVYDEAEYPFLADELATVRARLDAGRPIVGVCLGAQLIAAAAGAQVYPGPVKEIGWGPVQLTPAGERSCLRHLAACDHQVLHWHGDTFDLPAGAELLASTAAVAHQAFAIGDHVLGLQFHAELAPRTIERWLIGHHAELAREQLSPSRIRADTHAHAARTAAAAAQMFAAWLDAAGL